MNKKNNRFLPKGKKGAELTIGTIVIIVLALVVLVVLILGFTGGWGNLWGRISGFFGTGENVDSVVQACQVACTTESTHDYCTRKRTLKFESGDDLIRVDTLSCDELKENSGKAVTDSEGADVTLPALNIECDMSC